MNDYSELFEKDLVLLNVDADDRQELFGKVANVLLKKGYVKDSYLDALNDREDEFPTGVVTEYLPIALPHANPENVNRSFIAVVRLNNMVHVEQMGLGTDEETKNFFFLGIVMETQDLQVKLLQRFMQLMNDKDFVDQFNAIDDEDAMYDFLVKEF